MDLEIQVAVQFLISFLTGKFSEEQEEKFLRILKELLTARFAGHWYLEKPTKGSAFRCISIEKQLDAVLIKAAELCQLDLTILAENLPKRLDLWIDPTEVSYRIGEHGNVVVVYKEGDDCVNSTSVHLRKVLEQLPTVSRPSPKPLSANVQNAGSKTYQNKRNGIQNNPLANLPQQIANNISIAAAQRRLENQFSSKNFLARNNLQNLGFLQQNQSISPAGLNPLLMNIEYLQKLQWLAAGGYDPLAAQVVQNILIMQELQRFETRRLALQSHYLKMQNMRWPVKKGQKHASNSPNQNGLQVLA